MKLDISNFKKISENSHSAILRHPDGHHIQISKSALTPKLNKQLQKLPMNLADGGDVPQDSVSDNSDPVAQQAQDITSTPPQPDAPQSAPSVFSAPDQSGVVQRSPAGASASWSAPSGPQNPEIPMPKASSGSPELSSVNNNLVPGLIADSSQYQKGVNLEAKAQGQQGAQLAQAASDDAKAMEGIHSEYLSKEKSLNDNINAARQDVKNGYINPHHYMESKTALGKVATAIGLVFGGIGGGLLGQENPAFKFLNAQIDRDIQAQKDQLGKKETVLSSYMRQYGDLHTATQLAMATQRGIYADKAAEIAGKIADPVARSQALQKVSQFDMQTKQMIAPIAQQQALMVAIQKGGITPGMMEYLPKDMRERAVQTPDGKVALAPSAKDAEESRKTISSLSSLNNQLNNMKQFVTHVGTTFPGSSNDARATTMRNNFLLELNQLHGLNRLNDNEFNSYKDSIGNLGSFRSSKVMAQLETMQQDVQNKMKDELTNHLEGYHGKMPKAQVNMNAGNYKK